MKDVFILRLHKGSLKESMKCLYLFETLNDLIDFSHKKCVYDVFKNEIMISHNSSYDNRINWSPVYLIYTNKEVIGHFTIKKCVDWFVLPAKLGCEL